MANSNDFACTVDDDVETNSYVECMEEKLPPFCWSLSTNDFLFMLQILSNNLYTPL